MTYKDFCQNISEVKRVMAISDIKEADNLVCLLYKEKHKYYCKQMNYNKFLFDIAYILYFKKYGEWVPF